MLMAIWASLRSRRDQQKNQALWQELMGFQPMLGRIIAGYEADPGGREDLLQEVMLAIWQKMNTLASVENRRAYCARIAQNHCVSHVRQQLRRPESQPLGEATLPQVGNAADAAEVADLVKAVRALPLGLREVLSLHLEGFSYEEIADVLGLSVANAGVRLHRARKQVAQTLGMDKEQGDGHGRG